MAFNELTARSLLRRVLSLIGTNDANLTLFSSIEVPTDLTEVDNTSLSSRELIKSITKFRAEQLYEAAKKVMPSGNETQVKVNIGKAFEEIIQEASDGEYDLIVKMCEGKGEIGALFFGTLDFQLLRKSPCPILIMKPSRRPNFGHILAATQLNDDGLGDFDNNRDGSFQFNTDILKAAVIVARAGNADLSIVNAWSFFAEEFLRTKRGYFREIKKILAETKAKHRTAMDRLLNLKILEGVPYRAHVLKGNAADVIIDSAQKFNIDLIVMGTVGRVGIPGFFIGNTAETVLNKTQCSVLTLKPRKFQLPIA